MKRSSVQTNGASFDIALFSGDHVVVDRLTAGQQSDLCVGAGGGENGLSLLGILFGDVLTVEDGNELSVLNVLGLGQLLQQSILVRVGGVELVLSRAM